MAIIEILKNLGIGITELIKDQNVVVAMMFIALLFGSFAMFKGLLRFAFADKGQFQHKERNVIAFMLSIMSTVGIFFVFRDKPETMAVLFGGFAGLFMVLFLVIFLMYFILSFAKEFRDEDGFAKVGPIFIFIVLIGVVLSSYLFIGYTHQVITNLRSSDPLMWSAMYNFWSSVLDYALLALFIFGVWSLMKAVSKKDPEAIENFAKDESSGLGGGIKSWFAGGNKRTDEEESEIKKIQGVTKRMNENLQTLNDRAEKQQKLMIDLNNILNLSKKQKPQEDNK